MNFDVEAKVEARVEAKNPINKGIEAVESNETTLAGKKVQAVEVVNNYIEANAEAVNKEAKNPTNKGVEAVEANLTALAGKKVQAVKVFSLQFKTPRFFLGILRFLFLDK